MINENLNKEIFQQQINSYISNKDSLDLIEKAYNYAFLHHEGQFRKSGEPYFVHVLNVGYELALLKCGPKTVAAGFLHDVIEDCGISKEDFIKEFDEEIYELVEAVTKIGKLKHDFKDEKEYQASNHRKIFIAMAKDVRVIMIKLVDRLHNMRTLQFQSPEAQKRIAKETLEVYAPVAHRLGIAEIKNELEDLSFMYLYPEKYIEIADLVDAKKTDRDAHVKHLIQDIKDELSGKDIGFRIFGRSKHLYSIYKKMVTKNKRFDEIMDLLAIRIVTDSKLHCYEILGYIHAKYKPIPGRFKDYIAMPKMNMYQSLHTTIISDEGRIFEVQIRTEEMDSIAERGIAAHWAYKEGANYNPKYEQAEIKKELSWLNSFSDEENKNDDAVEYMDNISNDIFGANIYVLSPKGRVIDLPQGSTPIDFAYRIHTEVGHQTVGSRVNDVLVPLNTVLKTGDVVELMTDKKSHPSEDWIKICKTNNAKNRIRQYLTKKEQERKSEYVKQGEKTLREELTKRGHKADDLMTKEKIESISKQFKQESYVDVMYALANNQINVATLIEKLTYEKQNDFDIDTLTKTLAKTENTRKKALSDSGVIVAGIDNLKISMASCCAPIYGDKIVGYVSKGLGVKIHRQECPKVKDLKERIIDVSWDPYKDPNQKFEANLTIYAGERNFLLTDIITLVAQYKCTLLNIKSSVNQKELSTVVHMNLLVEDKEHLDNLIANLSKVESVIYVERIFK